MTRAVTTPWWPTGAPTPIATLPACCKENRGRDCCHLSPIAPSIPLKKLTACSPVGVEEIDVSSEEEEDTTVTLESTRAEILQQQLLPRKYNSNKRIRRRVKRFSRSQEKIVLPELRSMCSCKLNCAHVFSTQARFEALTQARAFFHGIENLGDRRTYLSSILHRNSDKKITLLSERVCFTFAKKALGISNNQVYGVLNRLDCALPIATPLRNRGRANVSKEERIVSWLEDLASLHDPQPDKEFTILAYKRKKDVFREYKKDVKHSKGFPNALPEVQFAYFVRCWKKNAG
jgi:hypothetical protein